MSGTREAKGPKVTDLMRECGSTTGRWAPESPEHWRWVMDFGAAEEKVLALIKLWSVGRGSAFAVDDEGKAARYGSIAGRLKLTESTVERYCRTLHSDGRLTIKPGQRLHYRADVPAEKGEDQENKSGLHTPQLPPYIREFIDRLPRDTRKSFEREYEEFSAWRKALFAEMMAAGRMEAERVEHTILSKYGAPKITLPKRGEFATALQPKHVTISVLRHPEVIVQSGTVQSGTESAQSAKPGVYKAKKGSVQTGASLLPLEKELEASSSDLVEGSTARLARLLEIDDDVAKKILDACPGIEPEVAAQLGRTKDAQVARRPPANRPGFLLRAIPEMAKTPALVDAARRALAAAPQAAVRDRASIDLELLRQARATLQDPHATPDERALAEELVFKMDGGAKAAIAG